MPVQIVITRIKSDYYKISIHSRAATIETFEGSYVRCFDFVCDFMSKLDPIEQ